MTDEQYREEMEIVDKFLIEVVMDSSIRPTDMDEEIGHMLFLDLENIC